MSAAVRDPGRVVMIGGGLAAFSAAEALREHGHAGPVSIVDREPALYDRPPLSKALVGDRAALDALAFATAAGLERLGVQPVLGRRASALDAATRTVTLDDGSVLAADTVLIATGGRARTLTVPGADHPAVTVLRTFDDALALGAAASPGRRAVVVGGGLIGAEAAAMLAAAGLGVTLLEPNPLPLLPAVGGLLAARLHAMHAEHGIRVLTAVPGAIEATGSGVVVVLTTGERVPADLVLVGIGLRPNDAIASAAGLAVDDGVLVDARQATSADGVFAAGDVARRRDDDGWLQRREEHWEAARIGGRAAAAGMLGLDPEPRGAPWFWSDRHGVHLEAVGRLTGTGATVVRDGIGHPAVFHTDHGLLVGAATIDDSTTVRAARRLIDQRIRVSDEALRDPGLSLRSLLRAGAGAGAVAVAVAGSAR